MTDTARKLVAELEAELERLPEEEQEARAASYLEDLRQRREKPVEPYSSFTFLQEANLDLPADYSETYEERLYGKRGEDNGDA